VRPNLPLTCPSQRSPSCTARSRPPEARFRAADHWADRDVLVQLATPSVAAAISAPVPQMGWGATPITRKRSRALTASRDCFRSKAGL
jgi:hypothetical protein